jgi:hypothetical protein
VEALLSRAWWATALRGLAAGLWAVPAAVLLKKSGGMDFFPWAESVFLAFGGYTVVDSVLALTGAWVRRQPGEHWWLIAQGLSGIITLPLSCVLLFVLLRLRVSSLLSFGPFPVSIGVLNVVGAVQLRGKPVGSWLLLANAAVQVLFALVVLGGLYSNPLAVAGYGLALAALQLALAWRARRWG